MYKVLFAAVVAVSAIACQEPLTVQQAQQALEESSAASQAENLTSSSVELVVQTDFTIGDAVEKAAEKIKAFVASQLPCAQIELSGATLSIEYGVIAGDCTYNGHTYSGEHEVTVKRNQSSEVLVHHEWSDFTNGLVTVNGSADVTWSAKKKSRHVVHDLSWTRDDGFVGHGSGDRTQTALSGGIAEGIKIDGERTWEGKKGTWKLDIDGIEMRWVDPVPQAGTWTLETPFDNKSVTLSFDRKNDVEIKVTAQTGRREFTFIVRKSGIVQRYD